MRRIEKLTGPAPSFCKCTCFTNSTIIALSDAKSNSESKGSKAKGDGVSSANSASAIEERAQSSTCALCNRKFCLSYNLPICKGAEEKDVFTTCFQRDSAKDQAIVILFIGTTVGLLGWAGVQRFLDGKKGKEGVVQGQYARVGRR